MGKLYDNVILKMRIAIIILSLWLWLFSSPVSFWPADKIFVKRGLKRPFILFDENPSFASDVRNAARKPKFRPDPSKSSFSTPKPIEPTIYVPQSSPPNPTPSVPLPPIMPAPPAYPPGVLVIGGTDGSGTRSVVHVLCMLGVNTYVLPHFNLIHRNIVTI